MEGEEESTIELTIATWNKQKMDWIAQALKELPIDVQRLPQEFADIEETENTFAGNAKLKVTALKESYPQSILLGEDSGLTIHGLNGFPGVKTARFAAGDDQLRARLLLQKLSGLPMSRRQASFNSAIAISFPDGEETICEGVLNGWITDQEM